MAWAEACGAQKPPCSLCLRWSTSTTPPLWTWWSGRTGASWLCWTRPAAPRAPSQTGSSCRRWTHTTATTHTTPAARCPRPAATPPSCSQGTGVHPTGTTLPVSAGLQWWPGLLCRTAHPLLGSDPGCPLLPPALPDGQDHGVRPRLPDQALRWGRHVRPPPNFHSCLCPLFLRHWKCALCQRVFKSGSRPWLHRRSFWGAFRNAHPIGALG